MEQLEHPAIATIESTGYPTAPFAHLADISEIAHQCSSCGTSIREEQSAYNLCESCEKKALERFRFFLCNEFTDAEREYIDACVEGISLTEPEKIKDVKAAIM